MEEMIYATGHISGAHLNPAVTLAFASCPIFPGDPQRIHWSFQDPSAAEGTEEGRYRTFERVRNEITLRLRTWMQLPLTAGASA